MKVLVTGGAGFIGSNFIRYWLEKYADDHIVNLDALTYAGNLENLADVEDSPRYQFVKGDITDSGTVAKAMNGVQVVVHFAAESHVDRSILNPAVFVKTNILGTQVLLAEAVKLGGVRFHHVSTDEVYGALELGDGKKFSETTAYNPRSPYAASKAGADHLVRSYAITFGLPITISNCADNFGPYQFPEKLISLAITNALENKPIPVYGDGLYVRDWLHVLDHCRAIDLILQKGKIGETYCLGGLVEDIPNIEIVKKILRFLGRGETLIHYVKDRPGHDRRYAIDWSKSKRELEFSPRFDFDTALQETVHWYQKNAKWWQRVKSGEYRQYYQQQYGT